MPETVRLNNELQIIEVRLFEDVSWDDAQAAVAESRRLFDLHGIGEVLANFNEQRSVPDILAQLSFARKFPREMRFALHGSEQAPTASAMRFIETIARNRGLSVRRFEARDEALGWLKRKPRSK